MAPHEMPADDDATKAVRELFGAAAVPSRITYGQNRECSIDVSEPEFALAIPYLASRRFVLISLFCVEHFRKGAEHSLLYIFVRKGGILILVRNISRDRATSIATIFPSATWPERECRDGFGIEFDGAFDTRRLLLH
jgi:Ni,Fe-hydrogenase III component G